MEYQYWAAFQNRGQKEILYYWMLKGKYHCTVDLLLFYWFRLVCSENTNKNCQLAHSWFPQSNRWSTVQWYFPLSIPWLYTGILTAILWCLFIAMILDLEWLKNLIKSLNFGTTSLQRLFVEQVREEILIKF